MIERMFAPGDLVKHRSGNKYSIVCHATCEWDLAEVYVYVSEEGRIWVRPVSEMEDGRFERIKQ